MDTGRHPLTPEPDDTDSHWRTMYCAQRRTARILGATTVAASLLAVGAGAWGLSNADAVASVRTGGSGTSQVGPGGRFAPPGMSGQDGTMQAGPLGQDLGSMLINSDGTVDTGLLEKFLSRLPGGSDGLAQFLDMAVRNGALTQDQADAIAAAVDGSSLQET